MQRKVQSNKMDWINRADGVGGLVHWADWWGLKDRAHFPWQLFSDNIAKDKVTVWCSD